MSVCVALYMCNEVFLMKIMIIKLEHSLAGEGDEALISIDLLCD